MAIVYQHRRVGTNDVFYIGIGMTEKRAASHGVRNKMWHNVVQKAGGFEYDIIHHSLSWKEACAEERNLIAEYGRRDLNTGILVNMTNGGDGLSGYKPTEESNKKRSQSLLGRKKIYVKGYRKTLTEEHKAKLRRPKSTTENYKKPKSAESIKKSADSRRKITKEQVGIIHQLFIAGWTRGQIAVYLGVTIDLVQKWKHQTIKT
jgi:hypothetical protein